MSFGLLGTMYDARTYRAHVVPIRDEYGFFAIRASDPAIADRGTAFTATIEDPQPVRMPNVAWAVDGAAASVDSSDPSIGATVYVAPSRGGATLLHAYVGPPVNAQVDAPIFAYRSLFLGCAKRNVPIGVTFDAQGVAVARDAAAASDLYARGIACATQRRSALAIVAPLGATYVPTRDLREFAGVRAGAWHAGGRATFGFATYGTVLTRLRDGRTVKVFLSPGARTTIDAPYAIAAANGEFADVAFVSDPARETTRHLPATVRIPSWTPGPVVGDGLAAEQPFR